GARRVWAPDRSTSLGPLRQVGGEGRWRGTLVFDRSGAWAIQAEVAVPWNEYPCFYQVVEVAPSPIAGLDGSAPAIAAIGILAVVGVLVLWRFARRSAAG